MPQTRSDNPTQDPVISDTLTTNPGSESLADRYIIAGIGGSWSGFTIGDIVEVIDTDPVVWENFTPQTGWEVWVTSASKQKAWDGSVWVVQAGADKLEDLSDVNTASPNDKNVLIANGTKFVGRNLELPDTPEVASIHSSMNEPTGFIDTSELTVVWTDSSPDRTLTLTPVGDNFNFYQAGTKYTKTSADSIQIADTEGIWLIQYDAGVLQSINNPTTAQYRAAILDKAIVAIIYWDATNNRGKHFIETHGCNMDGQTHLWLHRHVGAAYTFGLGLGDFTLGNGDLDVHAQFSVAAGGISDEDIEHSISSVASTVGLEIWYLDGSNWRWTTNSGFSVLTAGVGDRLAYNNSGAQTEVSNGNYVLCHIFAWNAIDLKPIAIQGQAQYNSRNAAREAARIEIQNLELGGLPTPEMKAIGSVIFRTRNGYDNAVKGAVQTTGDDGDWVDFRVSYLGKTTLGEVREKSLPNMYVEGLQINSNDVDPDDSVDILEGVCRSDDDTYDMLSTSTITIDITSSGANGLDTGSPQDSTWYYIFLIANILTGAVAGLFSASGTSPTLPTGYTKQRLLGAIRRTGTSRLPKFITKGDGRMRKMWYDESATIRTLLSSGSETSLTTINCAAFAPPQISLVIILNAHFRTGNSGNANNAASFTMEGLTNILSQVASGVDNNNRSRFQVEVPMNSSRQIAYQVDDSDNDVWLYVEGYHFKI